MSWHRTTGCPSRALRHRPTANASSFCRTNTGGTGTGTRASAADLGACRRRGVESFSGGAVDERVVLVKEVMLVVTGCCGRGAGGRVCAVGGAGALGGAGAGAVGVASAGAVGVASAGTGALLGGCVAAHAALCGEVGHVLRWLVLCCSSWLDRV